MNRSLPSNKFRHSVAERLRFIDTHLFWNARINRSDLIEAFAVSPAQAASDFRDYLSLSPEGVHYDTRAKAYVADDDFVPAFGAPDAGAGLNAFKVSGDPLVAELTRLERPIDAAVAARVRRAARDQEKIRVHYQSFTKPQPSWRWVAPARLISDGQRWHMRAWCYRDCVWKDFVLARILEIGESGTSGDLPVDRDWIEAVELVLVPSERLSKGQRASVVREYRMTDGCLRITLPRALKLYALRRWGLDRPESRLVLAEEKFAHNG